MNLNCHYRTFQVLPVIIYDFVQLPILIKIRTTVFVMELVNYKFKSVCVCFVGSSSVVSITPGNIRRTNISTYLLIHTHLHILIKSHRKTYPHMLTSAGIHAGGIGDGCSTQLVSSSRCVIIRCLSTIISL